MSQLVYLDHAAATPMDPDVLAVMLPYFSKQFYNPSATYSAGQSAHKALDVARAQVAHWVGSRPSEIIFTAGGTEANNLAIHGVMRQFPEANIVISSIEHDSVLIPAGQYDVRTVTVLPDGRLNLDDLRSKIDERTVLVSVMYVNNEIGTIQPLRDVAQIINEKRAERTASKLPLLFHTDACQAANYLDVHAARLGVDLLTLNGGKIYGPKQSGALYVKGGTVLVPLITGGGQERGLRSGTENTAASIGFAAALQGAQSRRHDESRRLEILQKDCIKLIAELLPNAQINGSIKYRLANNIHLTIPGIDNERLLIQLDELGIMAAAGSACSASNDEPSHVLRALGLSDADAQASLRLTFGRTTTAAMVTRVVETLARLV
jgi:cysteine desulfurase